MKITYSKTLTFITFVILFTCFTGSTTDAQTTLRGTITSLNGEPIPSLVITPRASGQSDLFDRKAGVYPDLNGRYEIEFQEPGVYTLEIKAVYHQTLSLPIMIYDQDQMDMDIRMVPRPVNDGTYFSEKSYLEWIRACGNFNDYDFYTGIIFDINPDGSISAMLPADRDTIRYQIRGLKNGYVLPDEEHIHLRDDGTFEGIIIPPSDRDSVELRYDPAKETMYTRNLHQTSNLPSDHPKALLSIKDESDFFWIQPLSLINHTQLAYTLLNEDSFNIHDSVVSPPSNMDSLFTRTLSTIKDYRRKIETDLDTRELHPQQRAALFIAYVGLLHQEERWMYVPWDTENEDQQIRYPPISFFHQLIREVHPLHPLWARNPEAATLMLTLSDYDTEILNYTRQMVREHPDELVVRNLVIKIIEEQAGQYEDAREMPEYQWILERYGENNLARKAILAFREVKKEG